MSAAAKPSIAPTIAEMARNAGRNEFYAIEFSTVLRQLLDAPLSSADNRTAVVVAQALLATWDEDVKG